MSKAPQMDKTLKKALAQKKIYSYVGLAEKAGKLADGDFSVEKMVKARKAKLVLIAEDTAQNSRKKYENMCVYHDVCLYVFGTKESIGKAAGKEYRAMLAVCDKGLADAVKKQFGIMGIMPVKGIVNRDIGEN